LNIARQQKEPQIMILVLAKSELPSNHSQSQKNCYINKEGGHLAPIAGVHKLPSDLADFSQFCDEARHIDEKWDAVFVTTLSGINSTLPTQKAIDSAFEKVIHAIRNGLVDQFLIFNRDGTPLQLIPE